MRALLGLLTLALVAALLLGACGRAAPADGEALREPARSVEEVAQRAVGALSAGDHDALGRLLIRQAEYRKLVFPALPASAPEGHLDAGFAWENMQLRSLRDLGRSERRLQERGRPKLQLLSVQQGAVETYGAVRIHGPLRLRVRVGGAEEDLPLQLSVLERGGQFKLLTYRLPPR